MDEGLFLANYLLNKGQIQNWDPLPLKYTIPAGTSKSLCNHHNRYVYWNQTWIFMRPATSIPICIYPCLSFPRIFWIKVKNNGKLWVGSGYMSRRLFPSKICASPCLIFWVPKYSLLNTCIWTNTYMIFWSKQIHFMSQKTFIEITSDIIQIYEF
jgi:hypothetical protein